MLSGRRRAAGALTAAAAAASLAGCGAHHHAAARPAPAPAPPPTQAATSLDPVTVAPTTVPATTTAPPTTADRPTTTAPAPTTVPAPAFNPVVAAAMRTFGAAPGLEAPAAVPPVPAALSAQATDLGGTDTVDLVATPAPLPVNDPALQAGGGTDVGTFSSTPTTASAATAEVTGAEGSALDPCAGAQSSVAIAGAPGAITCLTAMGQAVDWTDGTWKVQVVSGAPGAAPATLAGQLAAWAAAHGLPAAGAGLLTATTGGATTLRWAGARGVYQTRSTLTPTTACDLAAAMRPWPAGS